MDPAGKELIFEVVAGGGGAALQAQRMGRDQGLTGWVMSRNEPVIVTNVHEDGRFYSGLNFITILQQHEPEKVPDELEGLLPLAQKALRQVPTLLFDLRPVVLETQGLVPALELYVERQQEVDSLNYELCVGGFSGRLAASAERAIFSIIQEAVGNVKRHAHATNVWITVIEQERELQVRVRDDGRGFDVDKLEAEYAQRGSLGVLNMRERAQAIGGRLSVESQPGTGTTISLAVPLAPLREPGG